MQWLDRRIHPAHKKTPGRPKSSSGSLLGEPGNVWAVAAAFNPVSSRRSVVIASAAFRLLSFE